MKKTLISAAMVAMCMLLIPLTALKGTSEATIQANAVTQDVLKTAVEPQVFEDFNILIDGNTQKISARDYVFGVVAAEMPAMYEKEALKAQAVAAYTFACYRKAVREGEEYDLTNNPETDQCYITREAAKERWGEAHEEYAAKIDECIDEVLGTLVTYNGETAQTVYHAISPGVTVSCKDVWGSAVPYLTSVESMGDKLSDGYLSEAVFTADELSAALKSIAEPSGEPQNYFSNITTAESGRVTSIDYCGKSVGGGELAKALSLRSANFSVEYKDGSFIFSVKGYGHGVGMSQNGANYMAKQGSSYEEILLHYYQGATLEKIKKTT